MNAYTETSFNRFFLLLIQSKWIFIFTLAALFFLAPHSLNSNMPLFSGLNNDPNSDYQFCAKIQVLRLDEAGFKKLMLENQDEPRIIFSNTPFSDLNINYDFPQIIITVRGKYTDDVQFHYLIRQQRLFLREKILEIHAANESIPTSLTTSEYPLQSKVSITLLEAERNQKLILEKIIALENPTQIIKQSLYEALVDTDVKINQLEAALSPKKDLAISVPKPIQSATPLMQEMKVDISFQPLSLRH